MPTQLQLEAESYWGQEIVTPELDWLGDELCRRTGRPATAFGSKGNAAHLNGGHRSQEWITRSRWCTNRTYTVQPGLTAEQLRHVAAGDWTPGDWGTPANRALMVVQTGRLIAAAKAGRLVGVRQIIGTLDGKTVIGYDVATGRTFTSDSSHLDHWHLTFDRRQMRNRALMERIVAIALGEDDDVTAADVWTARFTGTRSDGSRYDFSAQDFVVGANAAAWQAVDLLKAIALKVDIDDAEIARIAAAARPDVAQFVAALAPPLATAIVELLPPGTPVGSEELEEVLRRVLDPATAQLTAEVRDAVADLGEGGAAQVRADAD